MEHDLPARARAVWADLRGRLLGILGEDLVAMWAHGGTTASGEPAHGGDLDTHVILTLRPDDATAQRRRPNDRPTPFPAGPGTDREGPRRTNRLRP